ncbi:MAG: SCP2 sterol-binding domain-containing protein [Oscillospiraceae bacterium]|jgi:hypothetical protein|nr:SCP2 sterol-binding domain-containing protein [Oscillospiraceae bacterium]
MYELTLTEQEALNNFDFDALYDEDSDMFAVNNIDSMQFVRSALEKKILSCISGHITEDIMDLLLKLMSIVFLLDKKYRQNIKDFTAKYVFTSKENSFYVVASFNNEKMKVSKKEVDNFDFKLIFRDNKSLIKLLFSGAPDILEAMLNQEVDFDGNINYMSKFGYMALHLVNEVRGGAVFA